MKLIKYYILFSLLVLCCTNSWAQKPRVQNLVTHDDRILHFGFNIGINTMDFSITTKEFKITDSIQLIPDVYNIQLGFHVSIVSNLRLHKYLDLRFLPGIAFGQRKIYFIDKSLAVPAEYATQKLNSSFIDFPLLLKYKAKRINNFRPYIISGTNLRLDLAAKKDYDEEKEIYLRLKPFDYYYEIGCGFDNYLQYFKLSIEFKYSIGIRNILVDDTNVSRPEYVNSIDKMYSRLFMVSFYFE